MTALLIVGLVLLLLVLRQPLLIILLGLAGAVQMIWGRGQLDYIVEDMWVALNKEMILSIPLFLMCGGIMTRGSTAKRLIRVAASLTNHIPGGLGVACILACMVFAAISGSSIVTMLAVGGIMLPAMKAAGYSDRFALGVVLAGGSLGALFTKVIVDQFTRLRSGDRLYFEASMTPAEIAAIKSTSLSSIIKANTSLTNLQRNVFIAP